jgi:hypothetical protein
MSSSGSGSPSAPAKVETVFTDQAVVALRENAPEIYERFIKAKEAEWRHLRRLAWADLLAQLIGHLSGLVALGCLTVVAWHAIDRGNATQGASIICTGAVSIVAVFVTGRLTNKSTRGKSGGQKKRAV